MTIKNFDKLVPNGPFGVVAANDIEGGYHVYSSTATRNAVPFDRRVVGMLVLTSDTNTFYRLNAVGTAGVDLSNSNWTTALSAIPHDVAITGQLSVEGQEQNNGISNEFQPANAGLNVAADDEDIILHVGATTTATQVSVTEFFIDQEVPSTSTSAGTFAAPTGTTILDLELGSGSGATQACLIEVSLVGHNTATTTGLSRGEVVKANGYFVIEHNITSGDFVDAEGGIEDYYTENRIATSSSSGDIAPTEHFSVSRSSSTYLAVTSSRLVIKARAMRTFLAEVETFYNTRWVGTIKITRSKRAVS